MFTSVPTIAVIDLTASIGLQALAQLGGANRSGQVFWPQIALAGVASGHRIDWLRPQQADALDHFETAPAAVALLVGPGSVRLVQRALTHPAWAGAQALWVLLLPNALLEEMTIRKVVPDQAPAAQVFQLPDSNPHTLWFILMEQMGKLNLLAPSATSQPTHEDPMSSNLKETMQAAMGIDGTLAVALVDYRSGMCLAQAGGGMNLELAAAGNTQVVQAKLKTIEALGLRKGIEDILITLPDQYHLIRLVPNHPGLFLYLVLDKAKGNLALARYKLTDIERALRV